MFKLDRHTNIILRYLVILFGSFLYAVAIALFLDPNNLAPGGVTGIAIIVNHLTKLPTGALILCANIPLMALGVWKFGFKFLLSTIFALAASSLGIDLLAPLGAVTTDPLLAATAGGVLLAVGIGLIFKAGATTGGADIVVRLIKLKYKHIKTGRLFLMFDSVIVVASAVVFRNIDVALYAAIAVIVCSVSLDAVLYGADTAKMVFIITDKNEIITGRILKELDIGVTLLKGEGAYTVAPKKVLMCAMRKQILPQVQELAMEEDPCAFLIVTSASEIYGEGFKDISGERI